MRPMPRATATASTAATAARNPGDAALDNALDASLDALDPAEAPVSPTSPPRPRLEPQSEAWRTRCLVLAQVRTLVGTARCVGLAPNGDTRYLVPSGSRPGTLYTVRAVRHERLGALVCPCAAGQRQNPCSHVGAVLHLQQVVRAFAPPVGASPPDPETTAWFAWLCGNLCGSASR